MVYSHSTHNLTASLFHQWLEEDFLGFLDGWEESVAQRKSFDKKTRQGFTNKQKKMMLLSAETRLGLRITGKVSH